jgi:cellulose synthase/poly-beta-1,6-N-acetylglucosamine synthase-like glycosyltransferase
MAVEVKLREGISRTEEAWLVPTTFNGYEVHLAGGIDVVILARDEASTIGSTLRALMMYLGPEDRVHVVADHCHDSTAHIAYEAGAIVHVRANGGPAGKGQALKWWLEETKGNADPEEIIVVLDADSIVAPNFIESIRQRMLRGERVIQTRVEPIVWSSSPIAHLAAFSETTEQRVNDAIRSRLGWPVRLRGTGMAFRREILEKICASLSTLVEDVELTLQLGAMGEPIHFASETYVADPKPIDRDAAVKQRARWVKGQWQVMRSYSTEIINLIARGPAGWSLISSVLLKPKTLLILLKAVILAIAGLVAVTLGGTNWMLLASPILLSLLLDVGTLLYGVRFAPNRKEALRLLLIAPIYLTMWVRSLALSAVSGAVWHRVRPVSLEMPGLESKLFSNLEWYLKATQEPRRLAPQPVVADGGD